jgi:flagellin
MNAVTRGLDQGTRNAADMDSLIRTAEGGLANINNNLLRIRELTLQSGSGILTDNQRNMLQHEVDQLLDEIGRTAGSTQFNTQNLLDGSFQDRHAATNHDGSGFSVSIRGMSLEDLGIEGLDITNPANLRNVLNAVDDALGIVNQSRSELGARQNRIEHLINANNISSENLQAARSRIADADMALEHMRLNQQRVIEQYQLFAMRNQMDQERRRLGFIGVSW